MDWCTAGPGVTKYLFLLIFTCRLRCTQTTWTCASSINCLLTINLLTLLTEILSTPSTPTTNPWVLSVNIYLIVWGETFFYHLLDYVTRRSEKLGFHQKKKRRTLPDITTKLFVFGLFRNHQENNYLETSLGKLHKNYDKCGLCLNFFFGWFKRN